jgi:regulatory protein
MVIVKLVQKGENVIIYFDDGSSLRLDYNSIIGKDFRRNDEISENEFESLKKQSNRIVIKNSAFLYLSLRIHSKGELIQKLNKKGFEKELIKDVLNELEEKNILDDEYFARKFSEEKIHSKKWGLGKVKSHLYLKGIKREIIDKVLSEFADDEIILENAIYLLAKKKKFFANKQLSDQQLNQKLFSFLKSRGFNYELIQKALSSAANS